LIILGAFGIQGRDKCGFSDIHVGAFDVSSGGLLLLLIILVVVLMVTYRHKDYLGLQDNCFLVILVLLIILAAIGIGANILFSFISVAKVVYGDYEMWNPSNIDCSSPSFFSAFTYVTAEFVLIALIIIVVCIFLWHYCGQQQQ
jgi:hypothetical protein